MKKRPICSEPEQRVWQIDPAGDTFLFSKAGHGDAAEGDSWKNRLVEWSWSNLYQAGDNCLYALKQRGNRGVERVVALFALKPTASSVIGSDWTHLAFFEVEPTLRKTRFARAAFAFFTRMSADFGRVGVLFRTPDVSGVQAFYDELGADKKAPGGFRGAKGLIARSLSGAKLQVLEVVADALEV